MDSESSLISLLLSSLARLARYFFPLRSAVHAALDKDSFHTHSETLHTMALQLQERTSKKPMEEHRDKQRECLNTMFPHISSVSNGSKLSQNYLGSIPYQQLFPFSKCDSCEFCSQEVVVEGRLVQIHKERTIPIVQAKTNHSIYQRPKLQTTRVQKPVESVREVEVTFMGLRNCRSVMVRGRSALEVLEIAKSKMNKQEVNRFKPGELRVVSKDCQLQKTTQYSFRSNDKFFIVP